MKNRYDLGDEILRRLREKLRWDVSEFVALSVGEELRDPFAVLIATIISQNTNERNTLRAFQMLKEKVGIAPEKLANVPVDVIAEAIRISGMYRTKSRAIKAAAQVILNQLGGKGYYMRQLGIKEIYSLLLPIQGVGKKTVDVLLANLGKPVLPVDTHIRRIARRMGLAHTDDYDGIRGELESIFRPEVRLKAHLYLIKLGREICRARVPICKRCPLNDICEEGKRRLRDA